MPQILIADDEVDVREFLVRAFSRYAPHAEVTGCANGAEALEIVRSRGCDLLISDQRMPLVTGVELLRALREDGLALPVVIISADPSAEAAAIQAGATAFLYKPLNVAQIRQIVDTWLAPNASR
jgi:two-component system, NtrC family, response regulator AtoC